MPRRRVRRSRSISVSSNEQETASSTSSSARHENTSSSRLDGGYTTTLDTPPSSPQPRTKSVRIATDPTIMSTPKSKSMTLATPHKLPEVVTDSDLSSDDSSHCSSTLVKSPTVKLRSNKGPNQYTNGTTKHDNDNDNGSQKDISTDSTEEEHDADIAKPLVRRIRRVHDIGRPFTMGWGDEYLAASPIRSYEEQHYQEMPAECDKDMLALPSLDELETPASLPSEPTKEQELRKRRGGKSSLATSATTADVAKVDNDYDNNKETKHKTKQQLPMSFAAFRINYLIVHIAIMLADGLQGTHLYVLYEGYGYSVASLYSLGFLTGAVTSPFIGPFVDKIGRKKAAMMYCSLEMFINWLEQFPYFYGLIVSRMIGGITTNLLFSVFESWLVTEHRRRRYAEDKLETILRDSVILSNLAAIASGFLAEFLAMKFGAVGPFEGAVTCTAIALVLVMTMWRENYGSDVPGVKSVRGYLTSAFETIVTDSNISRIGLIQGLSEGSLQTFVFLWSPALARFAASAPSTALGLDVNGEPAYGLIFGAFMACGVAGGLSEPYVRKLATYLVRDHDRRAGFRRRDTVMIDGEGEVKPAAVEFMATSVYLTCAGLLLIPYILPADGEYSFSISLFAFLVYEFMVGLYMPCEGVIRSIYMPTSSVCSVMTMLRVIVNIAVALGVISTNYVPFATAFAAVSTLMLISASIQVSMVDRNEWRNFVHRLSRGMSLSPDQLMKIHFPLDEIPEALSDDENEKPQCQAVS